MLTIEQLATQIVERWETGDLAEAVREMAEHLAKLKQARLDRTGVLSMTNQMVLEARLAETMPLFQEARDALPAISIVNARLLGVDLTLAARMDAVGTKDWRADLEVEVTP